MLCVITPEPFVAVGAWYDDFSATTDAAVRRSSTAPEESRNRSGDGRRGVTCFRMRYRQLGASDLMVSEIGLGSWLTYGAGVDTDRGIACVRRAFEVGINFFDTANVYGGGGAEPFLGEALSGVDRDSYILGTKAFFAMPDGGRGLSAAPDPQAGRRVAQAAAHRLRRPLPVPPLRPRRRRWRRPWRR